MNIGTRTIAAVWIKSLVFEFLGYQIQYLAEDDWWVQQLKYSYNNQLRWRYSSEQMNGD